MICKETVIIRCGVGDQCARLKANTDDFKMHEMLRIRLLLIIICTE